MSLGKRRRSVQHHKRARSRDQHYGRKFALRNQRHRKRNQQRRDRLEARAIERAARSEA